MREPQKMKLLENNDLISLMETVTNNYTICNINENQLKSLQEWIKNQKKLNP